MANGLVFGESITFALDNKGNFSILHNPEIGTGVGKGLSVYARGAFGVGDNSVASLEGPGMSASMTVGPVSGSATLPYRYTQVGDQTFPIGEHGTYPPVVELGVGRNSGGAITYTQGHLIYTSDALARLLRWIRGEE